VRAWRFLACLAVVVTCGACTATGPVSTAAPSGGFLTVAPGWGSVVTVWSWAGRPTASVKVADDARDTSPGTSDVQLSPDGQRLLAVFLTDGSGVVTDLGGHVVARVPYGDGVWATDSQHICAFRPLPGSTPAEWANVVVESLDGKTRSVGRVSIFGPHFEAWIAECNVAAHEAVIFGNMMGEATAATYLDLRTGATTSSSNTVGAVAVSGDGRYVVLGDGEVRDVASGALAATVGIRPIALSWSGHVVVGQTDSCGFEAFDWQTGRVLWSAAVPGSPPCDDGVNVADQPSSDAIAVDLWVDVHEPARVWLVQPGRPGRLLPREVAPFFI
jgi:hypothetical protein